MKKLCRLCLTDTGNGLSIHSIDSSGLTITALVKALVPELYLGLSVNPVICKSCYGRLREAYVFRLQCLKSENLIGIYIRETKNSSSTIILEDVVSFWTKYYKEKPTEISGILQEWLGKREDHLEAPIILNQNANLSTSNEEDTDVDMIFEHQKQKDATEEQKKHDESEEEVDCVCDCSDALNCSLCKFDDVTETNKKCSDEENVEDYNDNMSQIIEDVVTKFDEFINKECLEPPEQTSQLEQSQSKTRPVRNYIKKQKVLPASTLPVNLVGDLDDEDISSLIQELQKEENLKKLGFSTANKTETYYLQKFIDADKSISFALIPKQMTKKDKKDIIPQTVTEKINQNQLDEYVKEVINKVAKDIDPKIYKLNVNGKEHKISESGGKIKVTNESNNGTGKASGQDNGTELSKNNLEGCMEELGMVTEGINKNIENLEEVLQQIGDSFDGNNKPEGTALSNSDLAAKEIDEESLGLITFPPNPEKPDHPTDSLLPPTQEKPPGNPMPIIRVKPVSSLQKVRTLNHELWPQKPVFGEVEAGFEVPPNVIKRPIKFVRSPVGGSSGGAPIVLNSKLGSPNLAMSMKRPPPASVPKKPQVVKTYRRKVVDAKNLAKTTQVVNPVIFKSLDFMCKTGQIKILSDSDLAEKQSILKGTCQVGLGDEFKDGQGKGESTRGSGNVGMEDDIDIKEEPLDCMESDVLMSFGVDDSQASFGSEDETTRSASETSFIDGLSSQSERVKSIVDNIPEVAEEQYDQPEYVRINQVSFSELTKMVNDSKNFKPQVQGAESVNFETKVKVPESQSDDSADDLWFPKYCYVPRCPSNSKRCPKKFFVTVPMEEQAQKVWYEAVGRMFLGYTSQAFCCEDHFDLDNDMENYTQYKEFGCKPLIKNGVLPHVLIDSKKPSTKPEEATRSEDVMLNDTPVESIQDPQLDTTESDKDKEPINEKVETDSGTNENPTMSVSEYFRHCFVPGSENNSVNSPKKILPSSTDALSGIPPSTSDCVVTKQSFEIIINPDLSINVNNPPEEKEPPRNLMGQTGAKYIRSCFVPGCKTSSLLDQHKLFVTVPMEKEQQKVWFEAFGRPYSNTSNTNYFCCENHFDIKKGMEGYATDKKFLGLVPRRCVNLKQTQTANNGSSELIQESSNSLNHNSFKDDIIQEVPLVPFSNREPHQLFEKFGQIPLRDRSGCRLPRVCCVRFCSSSSCNSPAKIFIKVPKREYWKNRWFAALRVSYKLPGKADSYVCENHFDEKTLKRYKFCGPRPSSEGLYLPRSTSIEVAEEEKATKSKPDCVNRYCFVPSCESSSVSTPRKIFMMVPSEEEVQKRWFNAVGRNFLGAGTNLFCCEDHFNMKEDIKVHEKGLPVISLIKMKRSVQPLKVINSDRIRDGVVPHKRLSLRSELNTTEAAKPRTKSRFCFVPGCKNTSRRNPDKVFVIVPQKPHLRRKWFESVERAYSCSSVCYCCEDHFKIEGDSELVDACENRPDLLPQKCKKPETNVSVKPERSRVPVVNDTECNTNSNDPTDKPEEASDAEVEEPKKAAKVIKYCFVPGCNNCSKTCPAKTFVNVPRTEARRRQWFAKVGKFYNNSSTKLSCCEDHFEAKMISRYKIFGSRVLSQPRNQNLLLPYAPLPVATETKRIYCFVPYCGSSYQSVPSKVFVRVPSDEKEQKRWFKAVGKSYRGTRASLWCCEDHFDLDEDLNKNYRLNGSTNVTYGWLKKGVVPHKFRTASPSAADTLDLSADNTTDDRKLEIPQKSYSATSPDFHTVVDLSLDEEDGETASEVSHKFLPATLSILDTVDFGKKKKPEGKESDVPHKFPSVTPPDVNTVNLSRDTTTDKMNLRTRKPANLKRKITRCFVPGCRNNTLQCSDKKIFIPVPVEKEVRREWFKAVGSDFFSTKSSYFCCEDHFKIKEDMLNYKRYKKIGGLIMMRKGVLPSKNSLVSPGK